MLRADHNPSWPQDQHYMVPPVLGRHVGFVISVHTFSWLFNPLIAWALGLGNFFPEFPGNDFQSIFPAIILHIRASMEVGVTADIFNADHYIQPEVQERIISYRQNIGGLAACMYGHAVAQEAGEQLRRGGAAVQSRSQWRQTEVSLRRAPYILQILHDNSAWLLPNAYQIGGAQAAVIAPPAIFLLSQIAATRTLRRTAGDLRPCAMHELMGVSSILHELLLAEHWDHHS